jgi:hypothetical protein
VKIAALKVRRRVLVATLLAVAALGIRADSVAVLAAGAAQAGNPADPVAFNVAVAGLSRAVNALSACGGRCPRVKIMHAYTALKAFGLIAQRVALDERCDDTYPLLQEHRAEQAMRAWATLPTLPDRHQAVITYGRYKVILTREVQGCWNLP